MFEVVPKIVDLLDRKSVYSTVLKGIMGSRSLIKIHDVTCLHERYNSSSAHLHCRVEAARLYLSELSHQLWITFFSRNVTAVYIH